MTADNAPRPRPPPDNAHARGRRRTGTARDADPPRDATRFTRLLVPAGPLPPHLRPGVDVQDLLAKVSSARCLAHWLLRGVFCVDA